jgi:Xaa-Pro aminopeptidase
VPTRYARVLSQGLVDLLHERAPLERIGVVGLAQVLKVEDYLALRAAFPDAEIVDASDGFERLRAVKSEEELEGVREATRIAERCFERLLEVTAPGETERAVGAEMYRVAYSLGGEDPLFLTMTGLLGANGRVAPSFGPPGDRVLGQGDQFIFSFELIGPLGYWMEFARMVVLVESSELQQRLNSAVRAGMEAAEAALRPGNRPDQVQRAILDAVGAHGARSTYWSGHGLGQDVIEEPWIGLDMVQDRDVPSDWSLAEGMVLAVHPFVSDDDERGMGYMADSYVVGADGGAAVSQVSLDLYVVG